MNNINRLKEQQKAKHPRFDSYLECMTRCQFAGLSSFVLSFSGFYFLQKALSNRLPYKSTGYIAVSTAVASIVAYKIVTDRSKSCQAAWMAAEDKGTALED